MASGFNSYSPYAAYASTPLNVTANGAALPAFGHYANASFPGMAYSAQPSSSPYRAYPMAPQANAFQQPGIRPVYPVSSYSTANLGQSYRPGYPVASGTQPVYQVTLSPNDPTPKKSQWQKFLISTASIAAGMGIIITAAYLWITKIHFPGIKDALEVLKDANAFKHLTHVGQVYKTTPGSQLQKLGAVLHSFLHPAPTEPGPSTWSRFKALFSRKTAQSAEKTAAEETLSSPQPSMLQSILCDGAGFSPEQAEDSAQALKEFPNTIRQAREALNSIIKAGDSATQLANQLHEELPLLRTTLGNVSQAAQDGSQTANNINKLTNDLQKDRATFKAEAIRTVNQLNRKLHQTLGHVSQAAQDGSQTANNINKLTNNLQKDRKEFRIKSKRTVNQLNRTISKASNNIRRFTNGLKKDQKALRIQAIRAFTQVNTALGDVSQAAQSVNKASSQVGSWIPSRPGWLGGGKNEKQLVSTPSTDNTPPPTA